MILRAWLCLLPLGVSACTFTVGIHRESRTRTVQASAPEPAVRSDPLAALVAEYDTELTRQCDARFVALETCAEQRRLMMAFRQSADKRGALDAWSNHAGDIEHPIARRPLLAILARIENLLPR
jgi:hypothetical protein